MVGFEGAFIVFYSVLTGGFGVVFCWFWVGFLLVLGW